MEGPAQPVLAEDDQQEVIYLVVDENPQGQQVTQIVSDGQLIGQHAQIIMQDGKQAVLITDGNQQQVVLLDGEVGPEQVQSALQHGAVQQTVLQQSTAPTMMSQSPAMASTSTANSGQVQYLVMEGNEVMSTIPQMNQPVVTMAAPQQHQLVVTQSGLVRIGGSSKKKDAGIAPGKSLINQAALQEAASKSPRCKLDDPVMMMGESSETLKAQMSGQTTLGEVISEAVNKQISNIVPPQQVGGEPAVEEVTPVVNVDMALSGTNAEINSTEVAMDGKENKDETDTIGFTDDTGADIAEAVEPDSTQSGCADTVNGTLEKEMISSVPAVDESGMVSVRSDIPPLATLPAQVMQDDEDNKSADETETMQVPQVFNVPSQTMEIDASDVFGEKEHHDDAKHDVAIADAAPQDASIQPTSTLIICDPQGKKHSPDEEKKQLKEDVVPSTVITVISPQPKKKKKRFDMMRQDESGSESQSESSTKIVKVGDDSIASRRERRSSKPTKYYGLVVDYEVYTADIYRSYRRASESGDEAAASKAKREQERNIEDSFGFDVQSTDDEQIMEKKRGPAKYRKSEIMKSPKQNKVEHLTSDDRPVTDISLADIKQPSVVSPIPVVVTGTTPIVQQTPIKRGRGRPPKHPRKSINKTKSPKVIKSSEPVDVEKTGVTEKTADMSEVREEVIADKRLDEVNTVQVAGEVEEGQMKDVGMATTILKDDEKGINGIEDTAEEQEKGHKNLPAEVGVEMQLAVQKESELDSVVETAEIENATALNVNEDEPTIKALDVEAEKVGADTGDESVTHEEKMEETSRLVSDQKLASESEASDNKLDDDTFARPIKKGTPGRPKGRPRKSLQPAGQSAKRNSQSDGESPRRSGRPREKRCYAESSGEESQGVNDLEKEMEKVTEQSNMVYTLQKEVTDLKFINDSLELRLAQQSGSPEEIRNLQARVDSLQMRNNELEAKLKNYEKSQKIGINIKGMKFSIKKDSASPVKSKPADVARLREIELSEQELRAREIQLEKRELKARALDRELDERGAQLTKRESKLDRWERKLKSQEKEVEYKEKRLKRLENDLRDLGGTGSKHRQFEYMDDVELLVQHKDLRLWEDELRQREAEMLEKEKLLAATEKQLMALNTELNEKAEYLQAKEQSHSSGDEISLTDDQIDSSAQKSTPFRALHSSASAVKNRWTKNKRQSSASLLVQSWRSTSVSSTEGESPAKHSSHLTTPKGLARASPKAAGLAKGSLSAKRKSYTGSQNSTPASAKKQKANPRSSGKKKNLKSPIIKAKKETPKSRKSEVQGQKKKRLSDVKSPKVNKTRRK